MHIKIIQLACVALAISAIAAFPQSPPPSVTVPAETINSGTAAYEAQNTVTTGSNTVNIGGSASALFQVLNTNGASVTLLPGFKATAGSQQITFKALVGPLATTPAPINGTQPINTPQTIPFQTNNTGGSWPIYGGDITFLATDGSGAQCPVEFVIGQSPTLLDTGTTSDGICTINSSSISAGSQVVTVNLTLTFINTPRTYAITTDAIDTQGNLFPFLAAGTWTVTGPTNFTMSAPTLSSVTVTPTGAQASYNQTFQSINGFSGPVSLSYKYNGGNLPAGLAFSLNSLTVSGPTAISVPITVTALSGTPPNTTYPISITAVGAGSTGTVTQTSSVTVVVTPAPSFSIAGPSNEQITNNTTWTGFSQIITASNGFDSPVTVIPFQYMDPSGTTHLTPGPINVSYGQQYWTPSPTTGTVNVNGMIQAPTGTATGQFFYYCYATGGGVQQYVTIPIFVSSTSQNSDFTLTPSSQAVQVTDGGSSFSFLVTISATNTSNFSWPGSFTTLGTSPAGWPSNVNVAVSPSTFSTLPATATVTITAYSNAPTGTYSPQISVTATNPNTETQVTHSIPIALTIGNVPTFTLSASPGRQTANSQSKASYQVNAYAENGFNSQVSFSMNGLPNEATYALTPSTVSGTGATVLTVTVPPVLSTTTYNFAVTGTSGSINQSAQLSLTVNGTGTAPATLNGPGPGSVLSSSTPITLSWTTGTGVAQYSLSVGSTPGATDIVAPQNLGAGVTYLANVAVPSGASQVNVKLGSLINSQWYYGTYVFGTNASNGLNSEFDGVPDAINVPITNNNSAITPQLYSPNSRNYNGFATACTVNGLATYPCKCMAKGSGLTAAITSVDSETSMHMQFTADDTVAPGQGTAAHYIGAYPVTCNYTNQTTSVVEVADLIVTDGAPIIDINNISPALLSSLYAGLSAEFTMTGYNLGATGQLLFCHSGTGACEQSINSSNSNSDIQYTVNSWAPGGSTGRDAVDVSLAASQGAYGSYDVQVLSGGAAGVSISTLLAEDQTPQQTQATGPSVTPTAIITNSNSVLDVPDGGSNTYTVTLSGTGGNPVQLSIQRSGGSAGSATFTNGTSTMNITGSQAVQVNGTGTSAHSGDVALNITYLGQTLASQPFSVVGVTIAPNPTTTPTPGDAAWSRFLNAANPSPSRLGTISDSASPTSPSQCAIAIEWIGTITPSDYAGQVTLRRSSYGYALFEGPATQGQQPYQSGTDSTPSNPNSPDDTSTPVTLDTAPQQLPSGANVVFDVDPPGLGDADGPQPQRLRFSFVEYAVLGDSTSEVILPGAVQYGVAISCNSSAGVPTVASFATDVPGDNQLVQGSVNLTANLQLQ